MDVFKYYAIVLHIFGFYINDIILNELLSFASFSRHCFLVHVISQRSMWSFFNAICVPLDGYSQLLIPL